jgi:hypothetical protein
MISFAGKAYGIQQDYWFEENILPDLYTNENGNYDSLKSTAVAKGTYGTVWGGWEELYLGKAADGLTESTLKYRAGKKYEVEEYTTNKTLVGNLTTNQYWDGNTTLEGNLVVPAGKILKLAAGAKVFVPDANKIIINGESAGRQYVDFKKHFFKNLIYPYAWLSIIFYVIRSINKVFKTN